MSEIKYSVDNAEKFILHLPKRMNFLSGFHQDGIALPFTVWINEQGTLALRRLSYDEVRELNK
jgi:hypothetical protein